MPNKLKNINHPSIVADWVFKDCMCIWLLIILKHQLIY